jgi:spoIIIJ-associated protein
VEWVETTGKTVEEAKEAALDQLGVDESEAEFELLEEPKNGLFGRVRREARVRARVEPTRPRPKADRRERRRKPPAKGKAGAKTGANGSGRGKASVDEAGTSDATEPAEAADATSGGRGSTATKPAAKSAAKSTPRSTPKSTTKRAARPRTSTTSAKTPDDLDATDLNATDREVANREVAKGEHMSTDLVSMEEQADIIEEFLEGLTEAFGVDPEIHRETIDDEMLELQVEAPDLGLLIGPKGQTLAAVQELARTVLQRKATGTYEGRVRIDISGYRSRRRVALERFATGIADEVRASGTQKILEPMSPPDRKVVHDTVNDLEGVVTASEGTEPYRRVVIKPA